MLRNRKASLELSIRAIVIIVLAMTLLGLGLGFIRMQFGQLTDISTDVQEQIKEQITSQLRVSGEKMSFPTEIKLSRGEKETLTLGVQNTGDETIHFGIDIELDPANSDHTGTAKEIYDMRYLSDICSFSLGPTDANAYAINLKAPQTSGTDMLIVKIIQSDVEDDGTCKGVALGKPYASKTSFISVG